jgi:hypothetical protein
MHRHTELSRLSVQDSSTIGPTGIRFQRPLPCRINTIVPVGGFYRPLENVLTLLILLVAIIHTIIVRRIMESGCWGRKGLVFAKQGSYLTEVVEGETTFA